MEKSLDEFLGRSAGKKGAGHRSEEAVERKRKSSEPSAESLSFALPTLVSSQSVSCQNLTEGEARGKKSSKEDSGSESELNLNLSSADGHGKHKRQVRPFAGKDCDLTKLKVLKFDIENFKKQAKRFNEQAKHDKFQIPSVDTLELMTQWNQQKMVLMHNLNLIGDNCCASILDLLRFI
eukprot:TRINITY_DN6616_c0_g2_i1.p2 TRINITY_DN6616_c0_g2~~TRINITY_DN6616_c0_g2_i1.p2  ORF type:complete len:179 (-),score=37.69 TRINITY_DN6616_c0_g2_i1:127-663(-)